MPARDAAADDERTTGSADVAAKAAVATPAPVDARPSADDARDHGDDDTAGGAPLPIAGDAAAHAPPRPAPADGATSSDEAAPAQASAARAAPGAVAAIAQPDLDKIQTDNKDTAEHSLTTTEMRILRMIGQEKTSRQIADELFVSLKTIENHRGNICKKLGISGNSALLKYALKNK